MANEIITPVGTELVNIQQVGGDSKVATLQSVANLSSLGSLNYTQVNGNHTFTISDDIIDCTANSFTVTFPTAVGIVGVIYHVKNSGTGTITVATTSSQTIDGSLTATLNQFDSITVVSTGTNWIII
jgi:hypothetical protein